MPRVMSFISCRVWMGRIEPGSIFGGISFFSFSRMSDDCLEKNRVLCSMQRGKRGKTTAVKFLLSPFFAVIPGGSGRVIQEVHIFPIFFLREQFFYYCVQTRLLCVYMFPARQRRFSPPRVCNQHFQKKAPSAPEIRNSFLEKNRLAFTHFFQKMTEKSIIILISIQNGSKTRVQRFPSHRHEKVARKGTFCLILLYLS